ncbi:DUF952 domain-containing protein [Streptomyces sp. ALI-76-A]|uniref:DUF952 domain-containing protein n=1 Tax=Streptomyces sp. ALI-76-A TaxID=3025736 RepID=UPI00256F5210|nr:DUF952 domain-containing protein [Streptomyces sp. ALI-76-A]MDL5206051.1 DUF952 domain-containing protein [Streptomyces sp. ALI-76-A]
MPERTHILHLTERSLRDAAGEHGARRMSTRGRTLEQGAFIRCPARAQLPSMAAFPYGSYEGPDELVLLVVNPVRLDVPVKYGAPGHGAEESPHVYGQMPLGAVVEVEPWR